MRTIKFRAKTETENKWVYGTPVFYPSGLVSMFVGYDSYTVNPKTIGQFTGYKDKYDKDIYEEDILICNRFYNGENFQVVIKDLRSLPPEMFGSNLNWIEITGNTYENPELLNYDSLF
jgi:hypothetical protein